MYGGTSPSKVAIWDEFSEQHQHHSIKKAQYLMHKYFFWCKSGANLMHILVGMTPDITITFFIIKYRQKN